MQRRSRSDAHRGIGRPILHWRSVALAVLGLSMAVLVLLPTVGLTFARRNPEVAVSLWPWGAEANAVLAANLVFQDAQGSRSAAQIARARRLAVRALDRQPVSALAAGALAAVEVAQDQQSAADRALVYSEGLSRRELFTQLLLIQIAVSTGKVETALIHYNRALRTSSTAPDILFPVLLVAADQPTITLPLARILAGRPGWWLPFTLRYVQQSNAPTSLATILAAERLRLDIPLERQAATLGMARLATLGRTDLAARLDQHLRGRPAGLLVNPTFAEATPLPPFDWDLFGAGDGATIEPAADGGRALVLPANGNGGLVARQLVRLAARSYRLAMRTEGTSSAGSQPTVSVVCVTGVALASTASVAVSGDVREDRLLFDVPASCPGQWVQIGVTPGSDTSAAPPQIRRVSLLPATR